MLQHDSEFWLAQVQQTLGRYADDLVRSVAGKFVKPRGHWPVEELIDRILKAIDNPAHLDRRIKALEDIPRKLLWLMAHSQQPTWKLGNLLEMLITLGHDVDLKPVLELLEAGLVYPDIPEGAKLPSFEQWLGLSGQAGPRVYAPPMVLARLLAEEIELPPCPGIVHEAKNEQEADGQELPLRLGVLWQQVAAVPMRRTLAGEYFKRDNDRLRQDPLLNHPAGETLAAIPDLGHLCMELALELGIIEVAQDELKAARRATLWDQDLPGVVGALWSALLKTDRWNPLEGQQGEVQPVNPFVSCYLVAMIYLARLPDNGWARPDEIGLWIADYHPYWRNLLEKKKDVAKGIADFLLGLAYLLKMVRVAKADGHWVARLSSLGRETLGFGQPTPVPPAYPQTILVQPNHEIVAYRQGLTPALVGKLTHFATWTTLGSACMLQLQPESVYRALESGMSYENIIQALDQHGMRPTPDAVVEALKTWANKRERLAVYASATLLEFNSPEELNEAIARGLPATRLSDRLAVVAEESTIDFKHFRLTGTRDYGLPPESCVDVHDDGVTLDIDLSRSDLMLETEMQRFANHVDRPGVNGRRQYRITPESASRARDLGVNANILEEWFLQRTTGPLPPAARFLLTSPQCPPLQSRNRLVVHVANEQIADGIMQWPTTNALVEERLGPTSLAVAEAQLAELKSCLQALGVTLR